jgi:hypothetical protein
MSCMVPVNSTVASERAWEALLRRREEKMALTPIKLVVWRLGSPPKMFSKFEFAHSPQPAETLASSRNRLFRRLCPLSFVLCPFTTACARARSAKPVGRRRRASDALKQRTPRRLGRRRPLSAAAQHHLQWCLQKWSWMPLRSCRPRVYPAPSDAPAQGYARRAPLHAQALRR